MSPQIKLRLMLYGDLKEWVQELPEVVNLEDVLYMALGRINGDYQSGTKLSPGEVVVLVNGIFKSPNELKHHVREGDIIEILSLLPGG